MKINCISCGHKLSLDDAYDNYTGLVRCWVCDALLEIKTSDGKLQSVDLGHFHRHEPAKPSNLYDNSR
jgi:hypothetical protein